MEKCWELCPTCGAFMENSTNARAYPINGEKVLVVGVPHLACVCGEEIWSIDQLAELRGKAWEIWAKE